VWLRPGRRIVAGHEGHHRVSADTADLLDRLRKTGHPLVLTINGKAELVVQDAAAYQALLGRVETIEGIQRGLTDVEAGRVRSAPRVFDRLRRKHAIPR
jgi:hypothetical protein